MPGNGYKYLSDDTKWYLPKGHKVKLVSREAGQEMLKKNHPHLYAMMKRHERLAK